MTIDVCEKKAADADQNGRNCQSEGADKLETIDYYYIFPIIFFFVGGYHEAQNSSRAEDRRQTGEHTENKAVYDNQSGSL